MQYTLNSTGDQLSSIAEITLLSRIIKALAAHAMTNTIVSVHTYLHNGGCSCKINGTTTGQAANPKPKGATIPLSAQANLISVEG